MNFVFFLSFTEGEQWICRTFSDIGKRQFNVEFLSHSPFRKINSERMFFCRARNFRVGESKGQRKVGRQSKHIHLRLKKAVTIQRLITIAQRKVTSDFEFMQ